MLLTSYLSYQQSQQQLVVMKRNLYRYLRDPPQNASHQKWTHFHQNWF